MKKNLSTRGAAALLALAMGYMGQGVAQSAYIQPKSARPVESWNLMLIVLTCTSITARTLWAVWIGRSVPA